MLAKMPAPAIETHGVVDKRLRKAKILQELAKAVKTVYIRSLKGSVVLGHDSPLVYWLDQGLRHGLRAERHGYWNVVRELSHQDTVVVIDNLQNVTTFIAKGKAWLFQTLRESSFRSYLVSFLRDKASLKGHYSIDALVRDADATDQLMNLLSGFEKVSFVLDLNFTDLVSRKSSIPCQPRNRNSNYLHALALLHDKNVNLITRGAGNYLHSSLNDNKSPGSDVSLHMTICTEMKSQSLENTIEFHRNNKFSGGIDSTEDMTEKPLTETDIINQNYRNRVKDERQALAIKKLNERNAKNPPLTVDKNANLYRSSPKINTSTFRQREIEENKSPEIPSATKVDEVLQIHRSCILTNPFLTDENFSEYQEYLRSYRSGIQLEQSTAMSTASDLWDPDSLPDVLEGTKNLNQRLESPRKDKFVPNVVPDNDGALLASQSVKKVPTKSASVTKVQRFSEEFEKPKETKVSTGKADVERYPKKEFASKLEESFVKGVFLNKNECLHRYYKVRSAFMNNGDSRPMLAIISDTILYFTATDSLGTYINQFTIPLVDISHILVGPNAQNCLISNDNYQTQFSFSTGSRKVTRKFVIELEIRMSLSYVHPPTVAYWECDDMNLMRNSILEETSLHPVEKIKHYSLVHVEEDETSTPCSPCGPEKEGDLMFRYHTYNDAHSNGPSASDRWDAGYFILTEGVLYLFSDDNQRLPKRAYPLQDDQCQGFRRIPHSHRPHTFEILLHRNKALQLAAPDENSALEWLESFIQSASGLYHRLIKKEPSARSLLLTSRHLVLVKEQNPGMKQEGHIVSYFQLGDVLAYREPTTKEPWCILNIANRVKSRYAVQQWIVYFADVHERREFRKTLKGLWGRLQTSQLIKFPRDIVEADTEIYRSCQFTSKDLKEAWQYLLPSELFT